MTRLILQTPSAPICATRFIYSSVICLNAGNFSFLAFVFRHLRAKKTFLWQQLFQSFVRYQISISVEKHFLCDNRVIPQILIEIIYLRISRKRYSCDLYNNVNIATSFAKLFPIHSNRYLIDHFSFLISFQAAMYRGSYNRFTPYWI